MNEEGQTLCFDNVQAVGAHGWHSLADARPAVVVVWGGTAANAGEAGLTRWLHDDRRRLALSEIYYHPLRTKNGAFPRPLYFHDDRAGRVEFPACRVIGMSAVAAWWASPLGWGWLVPALERVDIYAPNEGEDDMSGRPFDFVTSAARIHTDHPGVLVVRLLKVSRSKPWKSGDVQVLAEQRFEPVAQ